MGPFWALLVLILVGGLAFFVAPLVDRETQRKIAEAKAGVRERVLAKPSYSVNAFLGTCGLLPEDTHVARMLLMYLANLLGVPVEKLAHDYSLSDLLLFSPKRPGTGGIDPFSSVLAEELVTRSDNVLWEQKWLEIQDAPDAEDELVEFISEMSVCQLLRFFSPLMKR